MAFSEGKVCYTGDFYLSIYAKGLKKKGDRTYITDDYLRLPKITEMKFYYEY